MFQTVASRVQHDGWHLRLTYDPIPDHLKHKGVQERGDGDQLFQFE